LWTQRKEKKYYLFAMGSGFMKLKAPLIWFDLLHVLDVLTCFPWVRQDARVHEMADILRPRADADGRFTPESIWMAWKDWDFGQKKIPSVWVTFLALRILKRMQES
jgi:hypothetical protein